MEGLVDVHWHMHPTAELNPPFTVTVFKRKIICEVKRLMEKTQLLAVLVMALGVEAHFVVSPSGSDAAGDGSFERPYATLNGCINAHKTYLHRLRSPSYSLDGCLLRGGHYNTQADVSGVAGTTDIPFTIGAYDRDNEPPVVFDGTRPLEGLHWQQNKTAGGRWTAVVPESGEGVYQLFGDGVMWTPARWPNALFSDHSVFNWSKWGAFNCKF